MAKVSVDLGLTLRLPKGDNFEFVRPQISIQEVDVENVNEELELVKKALPKVWDEASAQLEQLVTKELPDLERQKTETIISVVKDLRERVKILESALIKIQGKK